MMKTEAAWQWLGGLSALCVLLAYAQKSSSGSAADRERTGQATSEATTLKRLHVKYLGVHFLIRLADWLQGTNMYTLYVSYGVDPGTLFMVGFATSAVCSTFVGHYVDLYGRKRACVVYCLLEIAIQALEHVPQMHALLFGRVLGGLSTSILFSAFESWIVTAHRRRGLPEHTLEHMFSVASTLNGGSAVLAGLIARLAFTHLGEIGPFQVSLVITAVSLVWILVDWEENTGSTAVESTASSKDGLDARACSDAELLRTPAIIGVALTQAGFEGCMFTFVFVWVQTFLTLADAESDGGRPPIEILFSCLMVALSIGGLVFDSILTSVPTHSKEWIGIFVFLASALSMGCAGLVLSGNMPSLGGLPVPRLPPQSLIMLSFCLFEVCVGMFDPWIAIMRSVHVPSRVLATVMTLARVPLNVMVGMGVHLTENYNLVTVFAVLAVLHGTFAVTCAGTLLMRPAGAAGTSAKAKVS